jgi:hypothetical protein
MLQCGATSTATRPELIRNRHNRRRASQSSKMVPNNVQLVQETALVDANRGSDPQEIYEDLKLEISLQPCPKLREQIVKDFIRSNPNVHNMKHVI